MANEIITIENAILQELTGDDQKKTLDFVVFLCLNEMEFIRGDGYWSNQFYWMIKFKEQYVCFILINGTGAEEKFTPLTIWSDDSNSNWYANSPLEQRLKEIAWNNVDSCGHCGSCSGGRQKIIFGKAFDNVCRTTFRFVNPDVQTLVCVKQLVVIRKNDIEVASDDVNDEMIMQKPLKGEEHHEI